MTRLIEKRVSFYMDLWDTLRESRVKKAQKCKMATGIKSAIQRFRNAQETILSVKEQSQLDLLEHKLTQLINKEGITDDIR